MDKRNKKKREKWQGRLIWRQYLIREEMMYTKTHSEQKKKGKNRNRPLLVRTRLQARNTRSISRYTHKVFHTQKIIKRLKKKIKREKFVVFRVD